MIPRSFVAIVALLVFSFPLFGQSPEYNPVPKDATDGILTDWGRQIFFNPNTYEHLYDNEAQYLENATLFGLVPPGGPVDPPLDINRVHPDGGPMGNGFNIISGLVCFDPRARGGTYWLAIDLPGPTNDFMSEGFYNTYVFDNFAKMLYPVPFDADCNGSRTTVDDIESGGHGSIIASIDEEEDKWYKIILWVGGDASQAPNMKKRGAPSGGDQPVTVETINYKGPGFPITILWKYDHHNAIRYYWKAWIDAEYLIDPSKDLILGGSKENGLGLVMESNPYESIKPRYDIEVEIGGIISRVFPRIDVTKVGYPMTELDLYHSFVVMRTDSDGDFSREAELYVGIDVPPLP